MKSRTQLNSAPPQRVVDREIITLPGEELYERTRRAFNMLADQHPDSIALPRTTQDVVDVIDLARKLGKKVAPQRTGHGATVLGPLDDTILLRTDWMQDVEINRAAGTARVAAGALWQDLVPAASHLGLAALHGSAPDVGIVGYTLGGGLSWYARRHGLAANSVTAAEIVTADGRVRRADQYHEQDLFWAVRGGGGSFGVVTALEFDLLPVRQVYAGALFFPWERSHEVLHTWRAWVEQVPDELTSVGRILQLPSLPEVPEALRGSFALVEVVFLGSETDGAELLAPLRRLGPAIDTVAMVAPSAIAGLHMDPTDPIAGDVSHALLERLPASAIDELVRVLGPGSGSPLLSFEIRHLGGALAHSAEGHGALGQLRGSFATVAAGVIVDPESSHAVYERFENVRAVLEEHETSSLFPNFTLQATDPQRFFDAQTLGRLRRIRNYYDPDQLITSKHAL